MNRSLILAHLLVVTGLAVAQVPTSHFKDLLQTKPEITSSCAQVSVTPSADPAAPGLLVNVAPGEEGYPGLDLVPPDGKWDLSEFGHVEAKFVNTGDKPVTVSLRVDNKGPWKDSPWNTEGVSVKPGESKDLSVIFGYAYGKKKSYALNPAAVTNIKVFTGKAKTPFSFRIESVKAGGLSGEQPPIDPKTVRIKPKDGVLYGPDTVLDPAKNIQAKGTASVDTADKKLQIKFAGGKGEQSVLIKPETGRWDLRDSLEITLRVRNNGTHPITPSARVESNSGATATVSTPSPLAPNASGEITISYIPKKIWQGMQGIADKKYSEGQQGTGTKFGSDAVSGILIAAASASEERQLVVESIKAGMPQPAQLPDWLGKRPPVEGEWTQTFADEFNGSEIDPTKWRIYGPNYWDKKTHWSKDNVILGGGVVKLRYEKKTGFQNDDPKEKQSDYACGLLESYGKWVQRYGYFEARMKLPKAPGLWPAFWLMPDRGAAAGPQWKRADTANGGMEFDIMEHLTRWGSYRYNIAMHWDGYQKDHKVTGSEKIYFQPDQDGFITAGLLWTPGKVVYYGNGIEVASWDEPRISSVPSNMLLTMPAGGWDNSSLDEKQLPDDFAIDYVRVWQRADLASAVDGFQPQSQQ